MNSPGSSGALIHGILAAHLDVAAERDRVDAVVGFAPAESRSVACRNRWRTAPLARPALGGRIVAKLVDQDHEPRTTPCTESSRFERTYIIRYVLPTLDSKITPKMLPAAGLFSFRPPPAFPYRRASASASSTSSIDSSFWLFVAESTSSITWESR
jgi:hypothetical protein